MEDIKKHQVAQDALTVARNELNLLYEISNAMRTTLNLDEILYIILTAVTSHAGLGFNRAMLFLVNEKDSTLEGKMGIGPDTGEEANAIWKSIEAQRMTLDDLISNYKSTSPLGKSQLNLFVKSIRVPLKDEEGGVLAMTLSDGMPMHIRPDSGTALKQDRLIEALKPEEFVTIPLKAKDRIIGVLFADNPYTHKPITKDDMRILSMFANQAGLAIENSQLYEQTLIKSHTDSLTGLWNHGYFQYRLNEEINCAKETKQHLSIIMADLDNFKIYNDTIGHQEGDKILKEVAKVLGVSARKQDSLYRYGGEEFAILLLHTSKTEAYSIAERIRQAIEKYHFLNEEIFPHKKLTLSLGLATFPEDASLKDKLLEHADKSLYDAKRQGKNRICG